MHTKKLLALHRLAFTPLHLLCTHRLSLSYTFTTNYTWPFLCSLMHKYEIILIFVFVIIQS